MSDAGQPWLHNLTTVLSAPTMVLSEPGGQVRQSGAQGAIHAHSRVLAQAVLEVDGAEPSTISSGLVTAGTAMFTSIPRHSATDAADPSVWVTRTRTVRPGGLQEVVRMSGGPRAHGTTRVTLRVAADLAVLTDIKAGRTSRLVPIRVTSTGLEWGTDGLLVQLTAPGAVATADQAGHAWLTWDVELGSQSDQEIAWHLTIRDETALVLAAPRVDQRARVLAESTDSRLPRMLARSIDDAAALRMVTKHAPGDEFLGAGTPWYLTLFGRDSLWAARMMLPFGWELARGTLRALASFQGRHVDLFTGEAPGKIPHELRPSRRPVDISALPPLYYGSIDATPLWICLLHDAWRWGMPADDARALLPELKGALAWMRDYGDADGDGLLDYRDHSGKGLANQGWKDSHDSIRFANGTIAAAPVTLCEVQGYAHQAAIAGADLLEAFGEPGAVQWRAWAARLGEAFRSSFWVTDAGGAYPALALDGAKRQVDALTSNIGHLLGTGLLTADEEGRIAERLSRPDMNSGFGLRTMSAASGGYSPLSYHCGSVWSHDTAIVILGLVRSGYPAVAAQLADGLLDAAAAFDWRLPELFSGHARDDIPWPSPYPPSCRPQAWATAAAGALVQAMLGLDVDVPAGTVRISPGCLQTQRPRTPLHVDGLVAGPETFSAGVDADGSGYLSGLSLAIAGQPSDRSAGAA